MYCASQGSDIAMEDLRRLNPEKARAVPRLRQDQLEGVGTMVFDLYTSDRFNVRDIDELEWQITQADMPPAAEVAVVPGRVGLLHFAASRGEPDAVEYLIRKGCDVNAVGVEGETPLLSACRAGHPPPHSFCSRRNGHRRSASRVHADAHVGWAQGHRHFG